MKSLVIPIFQENVSTTVSSSTLSSPTRISAPLLARTWALSKNSRANEKGRLSQQEINRMVGNVERFASEDEAQRKGLEALSFLPSFV